ncbi:MAG: ornithine cyclodeaminase family protein [Sedimenticola sp.]
MLIISAEELREKLDWRTLVAALGEMFRSGCEVPVRHHHTITRRGQPDATLLLMPAWEENGYIGVKVASVFPGNAERGQPAVSASYLLSSGKSGELLAILDGAELTARRTAAASALAAGYLAPEDSNTLLLLGTGRLSTNLVRAHTSVRPIEQVAIWGRHPEKAQQVADALAAEGIISRVVSDLETAVMTADIISCATLSREPLIRGEWLTPGTHIDLVGGFTPEMREADDSTVERASLFVDTRAGALKEAGDLVQPLNNGIIKTADIEADLFDLTRGLHPGRRQSDEITLFKSVGTALEDLAAAILAYESRAR